MGGLLVGSWEKGRRGEGIGGCEEEEEEEEERTKFPGH